MTIAGWLSDADALADLLDHQPLKTGRDDHQLILKPPMVGTGALGRVTGAVGTLIRRLPHEAAAPQKVRPSGKASHRLS